MKKAGFDVAIKPDNAGQHSRLGELRDTESPALLFEIGNIKNAKDRQRMTSDKYLNKLADTIAKTTKDYLQRNDDK